MEVGVRALTARVLVISAVSLGIACTAAGSREQRDPAVVRTFLRAQTDSLDATLVQLKVALSGRPLDSLHVRASFLRARLAYKRVEGVVEFYAPSVAASLNSRRQEVDDDDAPPPSTLQASGFPALEAQLWPSVSARGAHDAVAIVDDMRETTTRIRQLADAVVPTPSQLIEVSRQELARVSTLGIAGFDTPVTHAVLAESAAAVDGLRTLLNADPAAWGRATAQLRVVDSALAVMSTSLRDTKFDSFERLPFLVSRAIPAAHAVDALRNAAGVSSVAIQRFWRAEAASPYDRDAFNTLVFASHGHAPTSAAVRALGERLFNDRGLSGTGTRSCASCHVPSHAFTDGMPRQRSIDGRGIVARHTPTLLNAALSPAYFADERAPSLEEQVVRVLGSKTEMGSSIERATAAVNANAAYDRAAEQAFGTPSGSPLTPLEVRQAIAAYVRSLIALNSRFDRAVHGDLSAVTSAERHGFDVFMGKAGCGTCHFAPLFNGTTPPVYRSADVEVIGVPKSPIAQTRLDDDRGRGALDQQPLHDHAFKTPTVRNASVTGPYFHHGAYATLREVIDFYDRGGGAGVGVRIPNQTLSATKLELSERDKRDLEAFLGALADTTVMPSPARRPRGY